MNKSKAIRKFNKRADNWLTDLEFLSEEELANNPAEDSWSLAELYDHVMRVARTYQIPNFRKSITPEAIRKKRKNKIGIAIFNLGIRKQVKIKMQNFPAPIVEDFTPVKRSKKELIEDFKTFTREVNDLKETLMNTSKSDKNYHPMFGDINATEWFSLIEIHMAHHEVQRARISKSVTR